MKAADKKIIEKEIKELHGSIKTTGPVLKIFIEQGVLAVQALRSDRLTVHGMGTFIKDLKKEDVEITNEAKKYIKGCRQRNGLMRLEIWSEGIMAWMGIGGYTYADDATISVNNGLPNFLE